MDKPIVIMINLYIINENTLSTAYGIGTYIRELITALKGSEINVCVIHLRSKRQDMEIEDSDGIRHWYIPAPTTTFNYQYPDEQDEYYYRNILYLLQLYIIKKENKDIIFHINHVNCKPLISFLKTSFDCKIVLVIHYLNSMIALLGNISRLRRIISQVSESTDKFEKYIKESFLKEKEVLQFHAVDKIICLSNHTFDLLRQDYQIEREKIVVIYNGLSDVTI